MKKKSIFVIIIIAILFTTSNSNNKDDSSDSKLKTKYIISNNITLYFTDPPKKTELENDIINLLGRQSKDYNLDVCIYGFDNEKIINALVNAINNKIHVRFIGDKDGSKLLSQKNGLYYEGYFKIAEALDKNFPVPKKKRINFPSDSGFDDFKLVNSNGIMHNKFTLITDDSGKKFIVTGSTNFTETCLNNNNNNSFIICDENMFNAFKDEFNYLMGMNKEVKKINKIKIDGILFEIVFVNHNDKDSNPMGIIIDRIKNTKKSIHFMIYSFSYKGLADFFLKETKNNIELKGIFDKSQLDHSIDEVFVYNNIDCRIDGNENIVSDVHGGKLHHKVLISDHDLDSAIVITGSFNWSRNASRNNDENIMIIHSKKIAGIYEKQFEKVWNEGKDFDDIEIGDRASYQDIIINEIMWMGSQKTANKLAANDEFIELKNNTNRRINLAGWKISNAGLNQTDLYIKHGIIEKNGYFVIQTLPKNISAFIPSSGITEDQLSIKNSYLKLILKDIGNNVIDYAGKGDRASNYGGLFEAKANGLKKSLSRKKIYGDGRNPENWFTANGQKNISNKYEYLKFNYATPGADNK